MVIRRILGLFSLDMGIDLGTANTLVCVQGEGIIISEPSVVAVKKGTNQILMDGRAVGLVAKEMLGKTPGSIEAIRPLKDGVIADFDITESMLRYFINKVHKRTWAVKPRVMIAIPSGITAVEKRAVLNSAERAGASEVYLISEPLAAAMGAGLPIADATGSMIVDIGGGTTEVAVISLGDMVCSHSIRMAGDDMNEAIIQHMKRAYNLMIGEQTAERIKIQIGSASELEEEYSMEVAGRDLIAGLPRRTTVTSEEIRDALHEPVNAIIEAIKSTLEETPPELAADLVERGMTLAGGGSLLRGLDQVIARESGLPVHLCDDALQAVAKGTGLVLDNLNLFRDALESAEDNL